MSVVLDCTCTLLSYVAEFLRFRKCGDIMTSRVWGRDKAGASTILIKYIQRRKERARRQNTLYRIYLACSFLTENSIISASNLHLHCCH